jgi:hypothetical protein
MSARPCAEGKAFFSSGDVASARWCYLRALAPARKDLAVLLSNRAECRLRGDAAADQPESGGCVTGGGAGSSCAGALLDATAAVALCPAVAKVGRCKLTG